MGQARIDLVRSPPFRTLLAAALLLRAATAAGAADPPKAPADATKALETRRAELKSVEKRKRTLRKSVSEIAKERAEIKKRLVDTAALVQKSEARLTATEKRLKELQIREKSLRGSLEKRYAEISGLLSALQRMGRNPPPVIITRREDALKMVRSAMLLATAFPEMRTKALALAKKLNQLVAVMTDIRSESEQIKKETDRLNDMRTRLSSLLETKKQSLAEHEAELVQARNTALEISKSVSDLNDLISRLDVELAKPKAMAAFEAETDALPPSNRSAPKTAPVAGPAGGASVASGAPAKPAPEPPKAKPTETEVAALLPPPSTAPVRPPVVELAPAGPSLMPGRPGRIKPAIPFSAARARLPLPAQGRRVLSFGEKTQYGGKSKGLVLETRPSAQVTSPCDGWIVYAGEFRSYGQLLIINAGGGYHVLVAGLSRIDVQPGQFVIAAEPVGTMSGAPRAAPGTLKNAAQVSTQDSAQSNSPVLYVEFRRNGKPIDPDPWWVASQ
jgi:murein hydrolase activator